MTRPKTNVYAVIKDVIFVSLWKRRRKIVSYALTYIVEGGNAQFSGVLAEFVAAVVVGVGELEDDE